MERPWKQTIEWRGGCGGAVKVCAVLGGGRRGGKGRPGVGEGHRPGAPGGARDRRGACGNVDHGGIRHPPRVSKERVLETLRLKLRAPQFYPDLRSREASVRWRSAVLCDDARNPRSPVKSHRSERKG